MLHAFTHPSSVEDARAATGFVGSLRPYTGKLYPENFHEVMAALATLALELEQPTVDREIIGALWGITHFARAWGLEPDGMLRRNDLISDEDVDTLSSWVDAISYATVTLLDGGGLDEAFSSYREIQREDRT